MLVANSIDGDSRVQKSARSFSEAGWEVHLLGVSPSGKREQYSLGNVVVHRLPVPKLTERRWSRHLPRLRHPFAYSQQQYAFDAESKIRINWVNIEERRARTPSRLSRLLSPVYVSSRVGGKVYRRWLKTRARSTKKYFGLRKALPGSDARVLIDDFETGVWKALRPRNNWRTLDMTNYRFELAFRDTIIGLRPNVIHAHDIRPLGVAVRCANHFKLKGMAVPVVYDAHEYINGLEGMPSRLRSSLTSYERAYIKKADATVTVSPVLAEMLRDKYGLDRLPTVVLNAPTVEASSASGVDSDHGDVRTACGLTAKTPLAVYAGAAAMDRYLEGFVEAAAELQDLHLALMLNNLELKYVRRLRALSEELGISHRVHFLPYVPVDAITGYLSTADAGIIALADEKVNHRIALSTKLFEYINAGLPIVGADVQATREFITEHRIGQLYTPRDPASIAAAIKDVLAARDEYVRPYTDNQEVFSRFTWEQEASKYVELYEELRSTHSISYRPAAAKKKRKPKVVVEDHLGAGEVHLAVLGPLDRDRHTAAMSALLERYPLLRVDLFTDTAESSRIESAVDRTALWDRVRALPIERLLDRDLSGYQAVLVLERDGGDHGLHVPYDLKHFLQAGAPVVVGGRTVLARYVEEKTIGTTYDVDSAQSLATAINRSLSMRLKTREFAHRRRYGTATPWPTTSGNETRLWMGTANFAGQLSGIAQALGRTRPDVSAKVTAAVRPSLKIQYSVDNKVDFNSQSKISVQLEETEQLLRWSTHVISDAFRPVFGWLNGKDIESDLPALRAADKRVALLAHGSEIRNPLRHLEKHPDSLFRDAPDDMLEALVSVTKRNKEIVDAAGLPLFVTTPDLLEDLPEATWLPLIVDTDHWSNDFEVMTRSVPKVVHAPSRRWTKGTGKVLPYLEGLHQAGAIDFQILEGMPPFAVHDAVMDADIVIDQFSIGAYGTFACEGMAAGKPVIAYLSPDVVDAMGSKPPIVNCAGGEIASAMEMLLDDRDNARRIGRASVEFAREHHNGEMAVKRLGSFLSVD